MEQQLNMTTAAQVKELQVIEAERAEAERLAEAQRAEEDRREEKRLSQQNNVDMQLDARTSDTAGVVRDEQAQVADADFDDARRVDDRRRDEVRRQDDQRRERNRDGENRRHEERTGRSDRSVTEPVLETRQAIDASPVSTITAAQGPGSPGAPSSFADAAAQSRVAADAANVQERINERFQREQQSFDQRIERSHAPAERERLTSERDLQKHEHLATQKSRLLSHPEASIGKDPEIRDRLTSEVKEHHKEAQELRTKLFPENHAYQRLEQRGEAAELKSAQAGVHAASPATVRKVEELEQRHEKVKERVAAKEQVPQQNQNKRELEQ